MSPLTNDDRLLARLQYAPDLADACHIVLEELLRTGAAERAVIVVRSGESFRGIGYSVPDSAIKALLDDEGDGRATLREDMERGEVFECVGRDRYPELGFDRCRMIPLTGPRGVPTGAVLAEEKGERSLSDQAVAEVRSCGPTLARIFEVEVLRRRVRRVEQKSSLLDTVVDLLSDPVILTDHQNNFLFANRRAEDLFSAGSGESEGRRRAIRINDLLFSSFLTQTVIGGTPSGRELNLVDPTDGSDLLFEVITLSVPGSVRQDGAVISVLRDITDLKKALTELEVQFNRSRAAEQGARRESDRLNAIIGNVGDPILVTDEKSRIMLMNAEAERLFESEGDDGEHLPSQRAVRTNDTKFTTLISDFLLQTDARRVENLILTDPDSDEVLPVEVVSSKITDWRGEVSAIVSVLHDLTQLVENERLARELQILNDGLEERIRLATEELEERNRRLEWQSRELQKASRLKSEFLASMSHELRTPINAMLGYTALMREKIYGELNDKQENALRKIHGASQHLLALINDILDLSKIEAGRMPVRVESVRLDTLVGELSQTIEPMVREKELAFGVEVADDLPTLKTDRTKLKQILLNLMSNAVKFTSEGGVEVRAYSVGAGDRVRMEVLDTGIGIAPEDMETIFDDFRQVDQSATRKYGGTGLGLSITRKLVNLMNGSISVRSTQGEGSTFVVELPTELEVQNEDAETVEDAAEPVTDVPESPAVET